MEDSHGRPMIKCISETPRRLSTWCFLEQDSDLVTTNHVGLYALTDADAALGKQ